MNYLRHLQLSRMFEAEGGGGAIPAPKPTPAPKPAAAAAPVIEDEEDDDDPVSPKDKREVQVSYLRKLRAEAKASRLRADALGAERAKADTERTTAENARKTLEEATKAAEERVAALQKTMNDKAVRSELRLRAQEAGILDMDYLKLIDTSSVKVDEDGEVQLPKDFFARLKESKPHYFATSGADRGQTSSGYQAPSPAPQARKRVQDMSPDEVRAERTRIRLGTY